MTTTAPSTALATIQPAFTDAERIALAGFLAGYRGLTREAYALDLRQFASWCRARSLALFAVRRADIESFARELEAMGRARATVTRRLSTIAGFYNYAVEEELLDRSPAAHVRRPRVDYESHAAALDRNDTASSSARSRLDGNSDPGASRPERIAARSACSSCRRSGTPAVNVIPRSTRRSYLGPGPKHDEEAVRYRTSQVDSYLTERLDRITGPLAN